MDKENFDFISTLLMKRSGLVLGEEKKYLLQSRLNPLAIKHGMKDHVSLIESIRSNSDESIIYEIVESMTTNESLFFRNTDPFDIFRDVVLPRIMQARAASKSFRIWCCASSTGQEPYTIAIILKEMEEQLAGWKYDIVATDISTEALDRARSGVFTQFEVQRGMSIQMLVKYFAKNGDMWEISPELRDMVKFKEFNLLGDFKPLGGFDVVFCRNVLIYFNKQTKADVLEKISRLIAQDGFLYLGSSETVIGISDYFAPMKDIIGVYVPASVVSEVGR